MEYMDGEGEILVKGYEKDRDIYLEVQDNGLGMPEEEAAKLLTELTRLPQTALLLTATPLSRIPPLLPAKTPLPLPTPLLLTQVSPLR